MSDRVFTAHLPEGADPDRVLLIEDRWRWGAFLFPLLWALWSRHWLLALALLAAAAATAALGAYGMAAAAATLDVALRFILGWEGASFARLDRGLRGWRDLGGVAAEDAEQAERLWFEGRGSGRETQLRGWA